MSTKSLLTVVGVLALSLVVMNPTFAQAPNGLFFGAGQRGEFWGGGSSGGNSSAPSGGENFVPAAPVTPAAAAAPVASQSFFAPEQDDRTVQIRMRVPAGARVWFEDSPTVQTGMARQFVSPPLNPAESYVYHIRIQWNEGGQSVERTRRVTVQAGDRINLNFGTAEMPNSSPASR